MRLLRAFRWILPALPAAAALASSGLAWTSREKEATAKPGQAVLSEDFEFTNAGVAPVEISDLDTGCDCTSALPDPRTVPPGGRGVIHVRVELARLSGVHDESVDVYTNGSKTDPDELHLRLTVPETYRMSSSVLLWKVGGSAGEQVIRVEGTEGHTLRVIHALAGAGGWKAEVEAVAQERSYLVRVRPKSTGQPATMPIDIELSVDDQKPVTVRAYAVVASD